MAAAELLDEPETSFIVPVSNSTVAECAGTGIEGLDTTDYDIVTVRDLNAQQSDRAWHDRHDGDGADETGLIPVLSQPGIEDDPDDSLQTAAERPGVVRIRDTG